MKKKVVALLTVTMVLSMVACGEKSNETNESNEANKTTESKNESKAENIDFVYDIDSLTEDFFNDKNEYFTVDRTNKEVMDLKWGWGLETEGVMVDNSYSFEKYVAENSKVKYKITVDNDKWLWHNGVFLNVM